MHNIQGGFITEYFDNYNDNIEVDKKIGYIKDDYMNNKLDRCCFLRCMIYRHWFITYYSNNNHYRY